MNHILIFGTGAVADILVREYLDLENNKIVAFVNTLQKNITPPINLISNVYIPTIGMENINEINYDYILIASGNFDKMHDECIKNNIPENKIVGIIQDWSENKLTIQNKMNCEFKKYFNLNINKLFRKDIPNYSTNTIYFGNELWLNEKLKILKDYEKIDIQRSMSLKAVSHEIIRKNIPGNIAELGVYQGDFSKILNELFPDRKLYLFDTFGGFDQNDLLEEKKLSNANTSMFKDTSIDLVLSKMVNRDNCKIIKGYFPESTKGIEDNFAFVSLDADLYKPTYSGLNYFYKYLSHGGYIFIHDFNNVYFSGARDAVEIFCQENNINYVPIPDYNGSAIITK